MNCYNVYKTRALPGHGLARHSSRRVLKRGLLFASLVLFGDICAPEPEPRAAEAEAWMEGAAVVPRGVMQQRPQIPPVLEAGQEEGLGAVVGGVAPPGLVWP
ncbi:hypothetical protein NDU88_007025 [Pleurodeles waltl]|uniref:Uncharacterized protein n=1 Tax=Pleurodeles waltl TaxID=8319 RepID=A0AAV7WC96_PLEWA|nr:hypothetical protein NDU88_007025 [Pleurodeles waltl]